MKIYNIGDKTIIRNNLSITECYNGCNVIEDMLQYQDKEVTITGILGKNQYTINLDESEWVWCYEMFKDSEEVV